MLTIDRVEKAFAGNEVHDAWSTVYRQSELQETLNGRIFTRVVRSLALPPGSRILDAGCGTGEHTFRFAELGHRCLGVDLSPYTVRRATERARARGLTTRVRFACGSLDALDFPDGQFDAIHCRGVLMHVPPWERAVAELCRVLRPGGKLVILESNHRSVESLLVRLARRFRRSESRLVGTPGGLEFWVEREGQAPLSRVTNLRRLGQELRAHGVTVARKFAAEFWDLNRFPAGLPRRLATRFNRLWFRLRLPAVFSSGVALIGEKDVRAGRRGE